MVYAAASNRIREIRPSGIIGGLWETQTMEELGTHSHWRKRGAGHSLPTVAVRSVSIPIAGGCAAKCFRNPVFFMDQKRFAPTRYRAVVLTETHYS